MNKKIDTKIKTLKPADIETEEILLGTLIKKPEAISGIANNLKPEYFYNLLHKKIYKTFLFLYAQNKKISINSVIKVLKDNYKIKNAKGIILNLSSKAIETTNLEYEADIIRKKAIKRAIISAGKKIISQGYNDSSVPENIETAQKLIDEIAQLNITDESEEITDGIIEAFNEIEHKYTHKNELKGYSTGFKELDEITGGLKPSDLILIGGRPSMGKTAFALNIAQNVAIKSQIPVAILSLDMNKTQLVKRMLCSEGEIDSQRIRSGNLMSKDWEKLCQAMEKFDNTKLFIDDTCDGTFANIRAKCQKLKKKEKDLGLIVIDYLQLIDSVMTNKRKQPYSSILIGLKALAKELNVPIIVMTMLPRTIEQRKNKRPMLSDMRKYCDNIDLYADVVMFIYRENYYNNEALNKNAEIIVAKNKNGLVGTVKLKFNVFTSRFEDIDISTQQDLIISLFDGKEL